MTAYRKFLVALIPAFLAALVVLEGALSDEVVSTREWVAFAIAFATAIAVRQVPNDPADEDRPDPGLSTRG